jgi:hypothetical protein
MRYALVLRKASDPRGHHGVKPIVLRPECCVPQLPGIPARERRKSSYLGNYPVGLRLVQRARYKRPTDRLWEYLNARAPIAERFKEFEAYEHPELIRVRKGRI